MKTFLELNKTKEWEHVLRDVIHVSCGTSYCYDLPDIRQISLSSSVLVQFEQWIETNNNHSAFLTAALWFVTVVSGREGDFKMFKMFKMLMPEQIINKQPDKCIFNLPKLPGKTHSSLGLHSKSLICSLYIVHIL